MLRVFLFIFTLESYEIFNFIYYVFTYFNFFCFLPVSSFVICIISSMDSSTSQNTTRKFICAVCQRNYASKSACRQHITSRKHIALGRTLQRHPQIKLSIPEWRHEIESVTASSINLIVYNINEEKDIKEWMKTFMKINNCHFIVCRKRYINSVIYITYSCEHYNDPHRATARKKKVKGTKCQSKVKIILKREVAEIKIVDIQHNHSLTSATAIAFYTPSDAVQQKFLEMFENGFGPADALNSYSNFIRDQSRSGSEFLVNVADGGKVPNYDWVRHFFNKNFKNKYGSSKIDGVVDNLRKFIALNFDINTCKFQQFDEKNFGIAILTPLMRRISETNTAGELVFIDSCGSVDKFGLRVFLLMTKINAGGCPIGVIITNNETVPILEKAFSLFLSLSPSFGNRKEKGPMNIIIADHSTSKADTLKKIFPAAKRFLCSVHVLKFVYCWLWKAENGVTASDRKLTYCHIRNMMYAESLENIDFYYNEIVEHVKNIRVISYVKKLYDRKEKWALYFRKGFLARDSNTNNITERAMRVLKESILKRIKAQTLNRLVDFIINDYSRYYAQKLIDCALLKNPNLERLKNSLPQNADDYQFQKDDEWMYSVVNRKTNVKYYINVDIGVCTCFVGVSGKLCKHQLILTASEGVFEYPLSFPKTESARLQLYFIATGDENVPEEFIKPLNARMPLLEISTNTDCKQSEVDDQCISPDTTGSQLIVKEDWSDALGAANAEIDKFEELSKELIHILRQNPCAYLNPMESFNKELKVIIEMPWRIQPALHSFNKNTS